jgi:Purple acid Phosphatase, N-terminal domain
MIWDSFARTKLVPVSASAKRSFGAGWSMKRRNSLTVIVAIISAGLVLCSDRSQAQLLPPTKPAGHVKIIKGPAIESAVPNMAILRWTSTNPGGDDDHYAVAHYGTDPHNLSETARSHIRLNRNHPETIFRVRLIDLKPQTTYYYWVTSMGSGGRIDPVKSGINQFTTPGPGKVIIADPQPK